MSYSESPHEQFAEEADERERPVAKEKPDVRREPKEVPKPPVETALGKLSKEIEGARAAKGKISKEQLRALVGDAKAEYDKYQQKALAPDVMEAYEQDAKVFRAIDESTLERHVRKELKALKNTIRTAADKNAAPMSRADIKSFADFKAYRESKGERNVNRFDYVVFRATSMFTAPLRMVGNVLGIRR